MKSTRAINSLFDGPVSLEQRACDRLLGVALPNVSAEIVRIVVDAVSGRGLGRPSTTYNSANGVAVIGIYGVIVPNEDPDNDYYGLISCERIRSDLKIAMEDEDVSEVVLCISSPGGSVIGLDATAAMIQSVRTVKPVTAYSNGMTCSAAYYLGCQANELCVSKDSINGSIGVYATMTDMSRMYENAGFKVEIVRAGALKGAGTPGTPITQEQRDERQRIVDAYYGQFVDAVSAGRKIPRDKALALADGKVYVGAETVAAGLADSVNSFDSTLARLGARAKQNMQARGLRKQKGEQAMTEQEKKEAQDETLKSERKRSSDIIAAFPKHPAFANKMISEGKSVLEAKAAFADELQIESSAKDKEIEALKASQASAVAAKVGNQTIPTGSGAASGNNECDSPKETFAGKVEAMVEKGIQRAVAIQRVAKKHPELHRAMVAASNSRNSDVLDQHDSFSK